MPALPNAKHEAFAQGFDTSIREYTKASRPNCWILYSAAYRLGLTVNGFKPDGWS